MGTSAVEAAGLQGEDWTSVPLPIWVSEPSRLHAQLQRLERKLPHLLILSTFAVLKRNKAAM